ncbi:chemotaxis protein CheA [Aggregicoccus sp. 17bor-14]|uniref:chemotaxis protein CheA n=1 Tax=Myxococcaceae TaxID=31 RepID=UPI00129C1B36|nr:MULTISPECIES: chemotaxis protein CheA [Myxococcaceae]MBF5045108.1 chemotaxis protein CheA [Simulacricoccus sp. 17bor-14]MRI90850.1 chemotaxis protein CheA [Aggregicoccus sp. 17bor-14]
MEFDHDLLVRTFAAEAEERLAEFEQGLLLLEARPDDAELLQSLFRTAHTLKGSASLVGFDAVSALAHALEEVLEPLRSGRLRADRDLVSLLLDAADGLRQLGALAIEGRDAEAHSEAHSEADAEPASLALLRARLAAAAAGHLPGARPAPPPAAEPPAAEPLAPAPRGRSLRVEAQRLDRMLDLCGELAIARARVTDLMERGSASAEAALEAQRGTDRLFLDLQELVLRARMVPVGTAFRPLVRTVRDLAASLGKRARLELQGESVEIDNAVLEQLKDPLQHMVRNALDHGVEAPALRQALGKDPCARLMLRAFHEGSTVGVELSDDGAGIARGRVLARARERGLVGPDETPEPAALDALIFAPGFSTAETVTELSGRGVGLDVVRRNLEQLRGSASVESSPGQGTRITLRLPLTLALIQGFRVQVGPEVYVLPLESVTECLDLPLEAEGRGRASGLFSLRGAALPYLRLRSHFRVPGPAPARECVVVVRHGRGHAGLAVDALLGEGQTVVKPLGRLFHRLPGIAGSAILGDGRVALILDVPTLLRQALQPVLPSSPPRPSTP